MPDGPRPPDPRASSTISLANISGYWEREGFAFQDNWHEMRLRLSGARVPWVVGGVVRVVLRGLWFEGDLVAAPFELGDEAIFAL